MANDHVIINGIVSYVYGLNKCIIYVANYSFNSIFMSLLIHS